MSAVTKVFVILLAVLCIAFSMTTIAFTARTESWKSLAEDYRTQAQIADAHQRQILAAGAAELAAARDTIKNRMDRIAEIERENQSLSGDVAMQRGDIAQLTADKRRADALSQRLTNELGIAQSARAAVDNQRQQFESRNIELERRNIDLSERVNELTTQVTVINQKSRQQEQQIHILREENDKMSRQTGTISAAQAFQGSVSGIQPKSMTMSPRISGHVEYVDGELVTLSIGSADRVDRGAVFVVFRDKEYIGDVEITDVEPNLSSGRLVRSAPGMSPRRGDRVEDEDHFGSP